MMFLGTKDLFKLRVMFLFRRERELALRWKVITELYKMKATDFKKVNQGK